MACGGDGNKVVNVCSDGIDDDLDGKTDCSYKADCRRDSFCR